MREMRPWGNFAIIFESPGCKVKSISVDPGKRLSYQSHAFRDERWIIAEGTAVVMVDGESRTLHRGEMVAINRDQKHRLENPGIATLHVVEVQLGEDLDEDDIVRYEDDFGRARTGDRSIDKPDREKRGR